MTKVRPSSMYQHARDLMMLLAIRVGGRDEWKILWKLDIVENPR